MLRKLLSIIFISLFFLFNASAQRKLSNPAPSPEAEALYCYINKMYGQKILSGQMWSGWGFDEISYIKTTTGKEPAILGLDFIQESANNNVVKMATDWWNRGGIPTIMWHMGAPSKGEGYESSKMTIDINKVLQQGTPENTVFLSELKKKGDYLQKLKDANIPVLWRPFHELNGNWFWWGKEGPEQFKRLWIVMYNYYVNERKLNNLIWVLCYTGNPDGKWFPGNQYVDIAGADTYGSGNGPQTTMFNNTKNSIGGNTMPIAYHECGIPPQPDQCKSQNAMWAWWMEWHTTYIQGVDKTYLKTVYNHDLVITLDEVGKIMGSCNSSCPSTNIISNIQVNNGAWQNVTHITVEAGDQVKIGPNPLTGGSWTWTGCNTSGTLREQAFEVLRSCTATATYINACGTKSTENFKLTVRGEKTCCGTNATNGYPYCCTESDPDGDGWGWENNKSCIVPGSVADADGCGGVVTSVTISEKTEITTVYPVPCKESLTVSNPFFNQDASVEISIYSAQGIIISTGKSFTGRNLTINTSELTSGIYMIIIRNGNSEAIRKFVRE